MERERRGSGGSSRTTKRAQDLDDPELEKYSRQRPTLPHSYPCSTIGGRGLNYRVRHGNGCFPSPMTTGKTNIKNRTPHIWRVPGPPRHTYLARLRGISVKEPMIRRGEYHPSSVYRVGALPPGPPFASSLTGSPSPRAVRPRLKTHILDGGNITPRSQLPESRVLPPDPLAPSLAGAHRPAPFGRHVL